MAEKLKVAFIGTGIMGAPIARHLLDGGYEVRAYNRTPAKAEPLVAHGAVLAADIADAVQGADVVFTMVGYPDDVEEVYLAGGGVLSCAEPGATLIDLTTSSPELARDIADSAEVMGLHAFDCPVTGGESGAIAGTLTAIAGATEETLAPVRPLIECFASRIFCFGGPGTGQAAKLANQVALAGSMLGMADSLALAEQCGLDVEQVREMILTGTGASGAMETLAPRALAGDWRPGFMVQHFAKDLKLALACAEEGQIVLPGADTAYTLYDLLCEVGGGQLGTQAISLLYRDEAEGAAAGLDWSRYTPQTEEAAQVMEGREGADDGGAAGDGAGGGLDGGGVGGGARYAVDKTGAPRF